MDYKMTIATVDSLREAIDFIEAHTSRHSECIVAQDEAAIVAFQREIDAACVYANVSTSFTDGGQFGFGAEIGISTQKLHARGPMGLPEITTYKYIVTGTGQTRW
jgi:glutamate-5-semialdehyde dehydrogenase